MIEMSQINPSLVHFRWIFKLTIYFLICRHTNMIEVSQMNPLVVHFSWIFKLTIYFLICMHTDMIEMSQINPLNVHFRWIIKLTIYFLICRHTDMIEMSQINPFLVHFRRTFKLILKYILCRHTYVIDMSQINPIYVHFRCIFRLTICFLIYKHTLYVHFRQLFKLTLYFLISVMYYSNTPRHMWTALDVMVEEMDPTPAEIFPLRQKIEDLKGDIKHWDWLQKAYMLDSKTVENAQDFIRWKIRSVDHRIAKYFCALTAPVQEGDWDTGFARPQLMHDSITRRNRLEETGYL